jgi:3-oxoacyl-[acyl-carrier protein] reductase
MSDFLLELGQNTAAKTVIRALGLPIPMPPVLHRDLQESVIRSLEDKDVALHGLSDSSVLGDVAETLAEAGATVHVGSELKANAALTNPNEAFGRQIHDLNLEKTDDSIRFHSVIFDASGIACVSDLDELYEFFHPLVRRVRGGGRVLVISGPSEEANSSEAAAALEAIGGFVRSLAKEIGRNGATAQWLQVESGAESNLAGPLRFLLSPRSVYVSGQPLRVSAVAGKLKSKSNWRRPLEGKVIMLTGAARGIGAATVRLMATEGAKVICLDRPEDDKLTSQLAREVDGDVCLLDVTSENAATVICEHIKSRHGGIDVIVHNAGITRDKTLGRMSRALWDQVLGVNLRAVTRISDALLEGPLRENGRIICLSSVAGISGNPGQTNYAATKAGVIGLVRHLSKSAAEQGVTVNAIAPGFIETRLTDAMPVSIREVGRRLNNLKQGGQPEDVAAAVTFLATPGAQGLSGQVLRVCGGALIGA